jgi:TolB-like protein/Flp pilus assembly protein TadD
MVAGRTAFWAVGAGGIVVAVFVAMYLRSLGSGAVDSIAVLPFVNASHNPEMEYLGDGITENLINSLSQLPGLTVMSRSSVFHYKGRDMDAQAIGRGLKVRAVLTGRVIERSDSLSISAELVDVRNYSHLWGGQYNRKTTEILSVQEEIARQISDNLRVKLTGRDKSRLAKRPTESTEAYQLYLKGRYFWNQRGKGLLKAAEYFEQARAVDPQFALAHAGLADSYSLLGYYGFLAPCETYPKAMAAANRAIEIDPSLGEAHASLGYIHLTYDWDLYAARSEFLRAIQLAPNYAPAHYGYAFTFSVQGDWDKAFAEIEKSLEVDPLSPLTNAQLGWSLLRHGEYDRSIEKTRKAIELNPSLVIGHWVLGQALILDGKHTEAIAELKKAVKLSEGDAWMKGTLAYAYAISGRKDLASKLASELQGQFNAAGYRRSLPIALAYTGLGDQDRAFEFLEKAFDERDSALWMIQPDHLYDPLHSDPRWASLLRRIGIVPEEMLSGS